MSDKYLSAIGWKYTVWILAAMVFLCALFGLLYRPLPVPSLEQKDHELVPLRAALRKMSETDDEEVHDQGAIHFSRIPGNRFFILFLFRIVLILKCRTRTRAQQNVFHEWREVSWQIFF